MALFFLFLLVVFVPYGTWSEEVRCGAPGRFRSRDPMCKNYYLCVKRQGNFILRNYACPEFSIFNPSSNLCSTSAKCIEDICKFLPPSVTKITDPNGKECKTYIECVGPAGDRYPVVKRCEIGYFNKDLLPEPGCCLTPNCL